ncbi:MAG: ADP-glyceromanno-heptose 6-epimerase [Thermodesulfovibrio sp.]|uniref:ADP-glyceromanno-heptose 6-epimerase n=1 Tax=Thermodesulfovibrio sp. N1 TaxID=1871110 RepID=UPI00083ADCC7|nr:ADP-glyceromanno-heptose 6-epimerase [Thermodesulfovibrio sp. N1]MDI6713755.1 ADP-glyceromanno-heptose 6-epimerase [Thermodesulfovibrio sp.]ODA45175.1 ADP-L-glycero-D-manno-heptose-6-epimerase [Thermodesulfovibrio sp. N1]
MSYIIVTGGAGFIGANVVKRLNELGEEKIFIVDNLSNSEKWKNLVDLSFEDYIHKDKFIDELKKDKFRLSVKAIIHLGARSCTTERDVDFLMENNYEYTKELAKWSIKNNVRFIYASSAATYGDGSIGFSDNHDLIPKLRPLNAYGYSKQIFDLWALKKGLLDKIVGLKYFNVFGPRENHKGDMRSMVLKAYEQIKRDGKIRLFKSYNPQYKDGEQLRDFIYVKDAVEMTLFFLENPKLNGIFNVGTGIPRSWNDLAKAVFSALRTNPNIEYVDMPEEIRGKYQYFTKAEMEKIRKSGYTKPILSLEEAVKDYILNYLEKN